MRPSASSFGSAGAVEQELVEQRVHAGRILQRRKVGDSVENGEGRMGNGVGHGPSLGDREGGVFGAGYHEHRGGDATEERVLMLAAELGGRFATAMRIVVLLGDPVDESVQRRVRDVRGARADAGPAPGRALLHPLRRPPPPAAREGLTSFAG